MTSSKRGVRQAQRFGSLSGQTREEPSPGLLVQPSQQSAIFAHTMRRDDTEERILEKGCLNRIDFRGAADSFSKVNKTQQLAGTRPEERLIGGPRERIRGEGKVDTPPSPLPTSQEHREPLRKGTTGGKPQLAPLLEASTERAKVRPVDAAGNDGQKPLLALSDREHPEGRFDLR